jgi:dolichol kinase
MQHSTVFLTLMEQILNLYALQTHGESFTRGERLLILGILLFIEPRAEDASLFLATKHALFCDSRKDAVAKAAECTTYYSLPHHLASVIRLSLQHWRHLLFLVALTISCAVTQVALFRTIGVNLRRKIFHFYIFFVFCTEHELSFRLAMCLLPYLISLSSSRINRHLKAFLSLNDRGRTVVSHIYLLAACYYSHLFLKERNYVCTLISICFVDSVASITGCYFNCKTKSVVGTVLGAAAGMLVHYLIYRDFSQTGYYLFISAVEHFVALNDNITIPFFSVLFFKTKPK